MTKLRRICQYSLLVLFYTGLMMVPARCWLSGKFPGNFFQNLLMLIGYVVYCLICMAFVIWLFWDILPPFKGDKNKR